MSDREIQPKITEQVSSSPIDVTPMPIEEGESPLHRVRRVLRGRYLLASTLALMGIAGGAYAGWKSQEPIYRASGLIYIESSMPTMYGESALPNLKGYLALHVNLLNGPNIAPLAMQSPTWKAVGGGITPEEIEQFEKSRQIVHATGTNHILVHFSSPSQDRAVAGVQALINAYGELASRMNIEKDKLREAESQLNKLRSEVRGRTTVIQNATFEYGGEGSLAFFLEALVDREFTMKEVLADLAVRIRNFKPDAKVESTSEDDEAKAGKVNRAKFENAMFEKRHRLMVLKAKEERLAKKYGDEFEELAVVRDEIAAMEKLNQKFEENWRRIHDTAEVPSEAKSGATLDELKESEQELRSRLAALKKQRLAIGKISAEVETLKMENQVARHELLDQKRYVAMLEKRVDGRGHVRTSKEIVRPTSPYRDRRMTYAIAGGAGCGFLGLLFVLFLGLRDRRLRSAGDIDHALSRQRLLGLLPTFSLDSGNARQRELAGHCVHHIRTLLQIGQAPDDGNCICITGPGVGSGKTTLTTALGLSFGNAGNRTLLVDADLTGRGLTRRVAQMLLAQIRNIAEGHDEDRSFDELQDNVLAGSSQEIALDRPEPAELLQLMTTCIERMGLREAKESGVVADLFSFVDLLYPTEVRDQLAERLAQVLAEEGALTFTSPAEWITPRIEEVKRSGLNGKLIERYLYRTGVGSLRFLPLRGLGRGGGVSTKTISEILRRASRGFECTLVDTGPVPGAVETSMVTARSDSVVLVVSPQDTRPEAERAIAHMEGIGARIAGIVLNRADKRDMDGLSMSHSVRLSVPPA